MQFFRNCPLPAWVQNISKSFNLLFLSRTLCAMPKIPRLENPRNVDRMPNRRFDCILTFPLLLHSFHFYVTALLSGQADRETWPKFNYVWRSKSPDGSLRNVTFLTSLSLSRILSHLDADSLQTCEEVCLLWRRYIRREKIWKKVREKEPTTILSISNSPRRLISQFPLSSFSPKVVQRNAMSSPALVRQNGWSQHLPALGGKQPEDLKIYRDVSRHRRQPCV